MECLKSLNGKLYWDIHFEEHSIGDPKYDNFGNELSDGSNTWLMINTIGCITGYPVVYPFEIEEISINLKNFIAGEDNCFEFVIGVNELYFFESSFKTKISLRKETNDTFKVDLNILHYDHEDIDYIIGNVVSNDNENSYLEISIDYRYYTTLAEVKKLLDIYNKFGEQNDK